jgi:hypothetical protein
MKMDLLSMANEEPKGKELLEETEMNHTLTDDEFMSEESLDDANLEPCVGMEFVANMKHIISITYIVM